MCVCLVCCCRCARRFSAFVRARFFSRILIFFWKVFVSILKILIDCLCFCLFFVDIDLVLIVF